MENIPLTSGRFLLLLRSIFIALTSGMLVSAAIIYYLISSGSLETATNTIDPLFPAIALMLFIVISLFGAEYIFKKKLIELRSAPTLAKKANGYITALIIRYALFDAPSMAAIVVAVIINVEWFALVAAIFPLLMLLYYPTKERIISHLELEAEEKGFLDDPNKLL